MALRIRSPLLALVAGALLVADATAQQAASLSPAVQPFAAVTENVVALVGVRVIDGTGAPARENQTVILRDGRIEAVGPAAGTRAPAGARVLRLEGHTVMPGIIGLHDHMYYSSAAGGSMKIMPQSYPRLFLAAGVTTIRTTGSVDPYQELNLRRVINDGMLPGPDIVVTGPYLQGPSPGLLTMAPVASPEAARRLVRYWAEEGVTWFKAYTTISRAELGAAIDEAHRHGVKVTAHLCSVGFREAVALGIDNLEHGLLTNSEYAPNKQPDACPNVDDGALYGSLDINSAEVQSTIREMVQNGVSMTSTLAVMELSSPDRVPLDPRVLEAVMPAVREALVSWKTSAGESPNAGQHAALRKAMEFERAFVAAGGLLGAGSDPCCLTAIAGFADQRNFELLVEAGFTAEEAVQIMTSNGARILGMEERVGTIAAGRQADLIVLRGDLTENAADIRNVVYTFRRGLGYDAEKLRASVAGQVGLR
jgi:imidazolonepropionase-like amidohydrolase